MIDYKKMVAEIDKLTQNDFLFDMECKLMPKSKDYSQEEAQQMAEILSQIYSIAHCIHCSACQVKYNK